MAKGSRKDKEKKSRTSTSDAKQDQVDTEEQGRAAETNGPDETEELIEATPEASVEIDPLEQLQAEMHKARDDYLRLAAEFDNYKKRTARDFTSLIKTANEGLILNLLDFIDNFARALESGAENADLDAHLKGLKLVYDQLEEILAREGLSRFESLGEKFDPNLHEAMMQVQTAELEPDTVAQELAPGYKLHDKVIRHARVGVAVKNEGQ